MIWRVFAYLRFFPREISLNVVFNLLAVLFNLSSFVFIVPFIELLFGIGEVPSEQPPLAFSQKTLSAWMEWQLANGKLQYGLWRCLAMVAAAYLSSSLLSNLFRYLALYFLSPVRNGVIERLRNDFYHRATILPIAFFKRQRSGDILSRMSNDLVDIEWSVVCSMQSIVKDPINVLVFSAALIYISPRLFLYFLLIMPVAVFLINLIGRSLKRNATRSQATLGGLFAVIEESISNISVVKAFRRERLREQRLDEVNRDYCRSMEKVVVRRELSSPLSEVLGTIGLMAVLVLGGTAVLHAELLPSVFILFVIVFARLIPPVQDLVKAYNSLLKGNASASRMFEVIDADEVITQKPDAHVLSSFDDAIEYHDVSFRYDDRDSTSNPTVLDHIDLRIPKGKTIAIVGPSGSGKSTLVDLLPRFFDVSDGQITIDGIDLRDCDIASLRSLFAIVSQNCILFNDSVAANIAFGHDHYSLDDVRQAARVAFADDFISALPQGYDTIVGDRGMLLSGGQRQRLSIARAVLKNPPILILDEATSALDNESEYHVQQALDALMKGRTTIVIAHRLSTIRNADLICLLHKGKIIEHGTHQQLMEAGGEYRKMVDIQTFA